MDSATSEGQVQVKNDFNQGHEELVSGQKRTVAKMSSESLFGGFHLLNPDLQSIVIQFEKEYSATGCRIFEHALKQQDDVCCHKVEITPEHKLIAIQSDFITATFFLRAQKFTLHLEVTQRSH